MKLIGIDKLFGNSLLTTLLKMCYNNSMNFKEKQKTLHARLRKLQNNPTEAELHFKALLDYANINYIFQKGFIKDSNYVIVDFYLPKPYKICIEIDGGYHNTITQKRKDYCNTAYLKKTRGFKVIRFTNEEVFKMEEFIL